MKFKNHYFLLRHGQTIYQKEKREILYKASEHFELELTEEGKKQIEAAAKILKNKKIDAIFSSDFLRTRQTAGIVLKELGLEPVFDERLRDINMGEFHGRSFLEYKNYFKDKKERFKKRTPGGENWEDVIKRLKAVIKDIEKEHEDKNILIISHGDPLWLLAGIIKGFKKEEDFLNIRDTNFYPSVGQLMEI
jgi:broad specificity phosphatase PhoE